MSPTLHLPRLLRSAAAALALGFAATATLGATAHAAPPYDSQAELTDVSFVDEQITSGSLTQLTIEWKLEDDPRPSAGLLVELPDDLKGRSDSFPMLGPDDQPMGQCTVEATRLFCDFSDAYIAAQPKNLHGTVHFWVRVETVVTEETVTEYDFDDQTGTSTVGPPNIDTCPEGCDFPGQENSKYGWTYDNDTLEWHVAVKAPRGGMEGGVDVSVTDNGGEGFELDEGYVSATNQYAANGSPTGWKPLSPSLYSHSDGGKTVNFTSEEGWTYVVVFPGRITDGGAAGSYTNTADITFAQEKTVPVGGEVERQGGSAIGQGEAAPAVTPTTPETTPPSTPTAPETPATPEPAESPTSTPTPPSVGSSESPSTTPAATPPSDEAGPPLPRTGSDVAMSVGIGAALLALGTGALLLARRRAASIEN